MRILYIIDQAKANQPGLKHKKRWQETVHCNYQQKSARLIHLFVGFLGVDQFNAGNEGLGA